MSKIICDICGTTYPDTATNCPICGCSKDAAAEFLGEEITFDDVTLLDEEPKAPTFGGKKNKEIFDFDAVNDVGAGSSVPENAFREEAYDEEDEVDEDFHQHKGGSNVFVVILLTILIAALLLAAGFVFVRYFLPNLKGKGATPEVTQSLQQTEPLVTETQGIPCKMLFVTSGTAELSKEGQMFLLHVQPNPEDTTDVITYSSADESIATVTDDGKVTAVAEGETVIYISCGNIQATCPVVVKFEEETVPPTVETEPAVTGTASDETQPEETNAGETTPVETTKPAAGGELKQVTLKLKKTDIRLGVYYEYQLMLDCGLEQDEVQWRSEHPHIVSVDENGVIKALKEGTTSIIATYGDQEVSCIVRCSY